MITHPPQHGTALVAGGEVTAREPCLSVQACSEGQAAPSSPDTDEPFPAAGPKETTGLCILKYRDWNLVTGLDVNKAAGSHS